ncbi:protein of unknown function (plasmid) [Cupriavidus neocaledonicus]|uniref:Uncharacterized protein n=1 Tax=Cupriavidus neocaledonicus TaxID=1040979 RepID=A0A375HNX8_9BURK|nr:hypothetical protein CBM2605_B110005 [Cupriavidus neocaledonicus]SPD59879.1 protein of unknown function [Cupriavidus neocaledonicus]
MIHSVEVPALTNIAVVRTIDSGRTDVNKLLYRTYAV